MEEIKEKTYSLLGIEMSYEEFDKLMCEQSKGKELRVENNKVLAVIHESSEKERKTNRILELERFLSSTDYKAIQHSEGILSNEEFASIKAQREAWREEIRKLQKEVGDGE